MIWRGLTLTEPWATLVALGEKEWETRSWSTPYRGWVAIHAASRMPQYAVNAVLSYPFLETLVQHGVLETMNGARAIEGRIRQQFPRGVIVGIAKLVEVEPTIAVVKRISGKEQRFGDYSSGRWAFRFVGAQRLAKPIVCSGALSMWRVKPEIEAQLPKVA
jgi:hypothetical protein